MQDETKNEPLTTDNPEVGEIEEAEYVEAEDWEKEQVEKYEDGQDEKEEEIVDEGNMKDETTKEPITQPSSSVQTSSKQEWNFQNSKMKHM